MFGISWDDLSKEVKGTVYIILGSVLLLHTLNILQKWLNWILVLTALGMIVYGLTQVGFTAKVVEKLQRKKEPEKVDTEPDLKN